VIGAALLALVLGPGVCEELDTLRGPDFPAAVTALGSLTALALAGWTLMAAALACIPGARRLALALTPRLLRGLLFAGVVGALTLTPAHAHADTVAGRASAPSMSSLEGLRLPERPLDPASTPQSTDEVVVKAGDTLWAIAARSLPADAGPAQVATEVTRWHAANRQVIGDDPDLIIPLQRLTPPTKDQA